MKNLRLALAGNPNTGKSSVFNLLTGLRQHVGNFPGVTVDKRSGTLPLPTGDQAVLTDLPGTYSLFPRSLDEHVVYDVLSDKEHPDHPDLVLAVADMSNLERNLLLFTQLNDLGLPLILVLTMPDMASASGIQTDLTNLAFHLGEIPVVVVNGRTGKGKSALLDAIANYQAPQRRIKFSPNAPTSLTDQPERQIKDTEWRFAKIREILTKCRGEEKEQPQPTIQQHADRFLVHPFWGYFTFIALLFAIFQLIFRFAQDYPMIWIDEVFLAFSRWLVEHLPEGAMTSLLAEGLIPGIGGVMVFIPQIALLFFLLSILEESGYMARVVFIMDRLVRPFGLSGKSVVPLVSSVACAIPGIMATRTINTWKDRLITIMVAPLMSCSARIPVFMLMIHLVIPEETIYGVVNVRGAVLFGLYALGVASALLTAWVFKKIIKSRDQSFLLLELPAYQWPRMRYVLLHVKEKVGIFVVDAGKIIVAISVLLWALASYGPPGRMDAAKQAWHEDMRLGKDVDGDLPSVILESSFIGIFGKAIEPAIAPLGFDWKIGIAIITSFAAREVFVGSMATIYSVGEDFEDALVDRMRSELRPDGTPVYTLASGVSLMIFYVYAMQCMSTLAVVRRETGSWKWPLIQLIYMGVVAYLASLLTFTLLS